jgi:hypothetical protein
MLLDILVFLLTISIISDCDQFHWGDSCSYTCDCGPGASSCNPVTGCVCMSGWHGDKCDADVDEC